MTLMEHSSEDQDDGDQAAEAPPCATFLTTQEKADVTREHGNCLNERWEDETLNSLLMVAEVLRKDLEEGFLRDAPEALQDLRYR